MRWPLGSVRPDCGHHQCEPGLALPRHPHASLAPSACSERPWWKQRCFRPCRFRVAAVASLAPAEVISHAQVISDLGASLHGTAAPSLQHLTNLLSMWSEHTHLAHGAQAVTDLAHQAHDQPISSQLTSLYELADAATSAATPPTAAQAAQRSQDWLSPIAEGLEWVLQQFKFGLDKGHVPYSYGWSIVALTFFTKILTFPFTKAQVESAMSVQNLKPTIDEIKRLYGDDKDKVQRETSALYQKSGVNPLAGCLPTLATIPIFWGLFRTLSNVTNEGQLTEGFYWIPSLAGPASLADRSSGTGTAWLFPFVDGHPPLGWDLASRYLAIPVLLVILQYLSSALISPPPDPNQDEGQKRTQQVLFAFLPLLVGWFSISLPSGLGLYYFANIVLTSAQQIWLRKLGGAKGFEWQQEVGINQARRVGQVAVLDAPFIASCMKTIAEAAEAGSESTPSVPEAPIPSLAQAEAVAEGEVLPPQEEVPLQGPRRSKRLRAKQQEPKSEAEEAAAPAELPQPA